MIKGVLIYESDSGLPVYYYNPKGDIKTSVYELSGLVHAIRGVNDAGDPLKALNELPIDQFIINLDKGEIIVKDLFGYHERIFFHDNSHYSGIMSVRQDIDYSVSKTFFDTIVETIVEDEPETHMQISRSLRKKLDKLLSVF